MATTIKAGKTLESFLQRVIDESVKSTLYKKSLQEKEKQAAVSGGEPAPAPSQKPDASAPPPDGDSGPPDDDDEHSSKTMDDDTDAMEEGDVTPKDVVEKLNSIRSGHSFKDEKVKAEMEQYVESLSTAEKTALFTFLKGIAQIVTGEVQPEELAKPQSKPSDVKMQKGPTVQHKTVKPNVIKGNAPKENKKPSAEDTSGPVPITPKKKA
jgi:hypothetical protein